MAVLKRLMMSVMLALALTSALSYAQYPSPHSPPHYGHQPVYKEHARPYSYSYAVDDDYKGLYFSAGEASDGKSVKGSYTVALPDGRTQNVDYTADHYNGFLADVSYKGYASYPPPAPYHPAPYKPAPAPYKPSPPVYHPPAPVYHPAPYKPRPIYH